LRLTVRDNNTSWGGSDTIIINIDNGPPAWIKAEGDVNSSTFQFWFNEPVNETSVSNVSVSTPTGGIPVGSITAIEAWALQKFAAPQKRFEVGVGTLDGKLYLVGGEDDGDIYQKDVEAFNPSTRIWETLAAMPTARSRPHVTGLNGMLYVLGGINSSGVVNKLEVYDPETNTWSTAADPPFDNYPWDMAAEALHGRLYVNQCHYGIYSYDPNTDSWELISDGLHNQGAASTVIDDKLYLAGGWNIDGNYLTHDLVVFDPVTKVITPLATAPLARRDATGGTINGKFFVIGGNDTNGPTIDIDYYDPATDSWAQGGIPLPTNNWDSFGAVIGGRFYLGDTFWDGATTIQFDTYLRDRFELTLDAGQTLPFDRITVSANLIDDLFGNTSGQISGEFVPEDGNDNPSIDLDDIGYEVSGDISITYTITDSEGDNVDLTPEYSIDDGSSWTRATTSPDTVNIDSGSYSSSLIWYSDNDLDGQDITDVRFRIAPADNDLERGYEDIITLHVDNNDRPVITITNWTYSKTDTTCTIDYQLSDTESDTLNITAGYSTDMRATWNGATLTGKTSSITPAEYTGSVIWEVERDLPNAVMEVLLSMDGRDNDVGNNDEVTIQLNVSGVPSVTIDSTYAGQLNGDITIPFTITDEEGDYIGLLAEYLDQFGSWQPATLSALSDTGRPSTEYTGSIVWTSYSDLGGIDLPNSGFRLTPHDANNGFSDEVYFYLDDNDTPSITVGTPGSPQHRDVDINYNLSDPENDALGILALYSTDGGINWSEMNVTGSDTAVIGSGNYSGTVTWHCYDDLGYGEWTTVIAKILPYDLDPGAEDVSAIFTIENYVGDYSADGSVNSSDFATLIYAYNAQDPYHDIGPATGSVPQLIPVFDGVIDFEDLAVFIQMWNWSLGITAQQAEVERPGSLVKPTSAQRENQNHSVLLEEKLSDDPWAADDGVMDLELKASHVSGVMVASVEVGYDPEHLKFLSLEPGTFMGRPAGSSQSLIYLQNVDEEKGRLSLLLGRIDPEDPDVSGSGLLASTHFAKLSKENSNITVAYELWNRDAELLVQDQYQTEVHALRIPGEFALLQNYPNPFNGETVIRFQLPQAARVQMYVFNIRGQRVATLADEQMDPGYHKITWDGRNEDNRKVASGIYIYLIQAGRNRASQKLTIIK
jgi:N-acetylneuraminic acid mutarotase